MASRLPNYSCDEIDWLTDEPFQPRVTDGNSGGTGLYWEVIARLP